MQRGQQSAGAATERPGREKVEHGAIFRVRLSGLDAIAFRDYDEPDIWHINSSVKADDIETGTNGEFITKWQGNEPTREDVFKVIMTMLRHEVAEQLGLDPHRNSVPREDEST